MARKRGKPHTPAAKQTAEPRGGTPPTAPALVVGIGASAGGLAPITTLLAHLRPGSGLTIILVQHLGVGGEVLLAALGQAKTSLKVMEAADGIFLLPDHVYVASGQSLLSVVDGRFSIQDVMQCEGLRMPIDHFFCGLAADQGRRSVGIILSGTGTDGTGGLAEIRVAGGMTVVQDPQTAEFPDMPANAIAAGYADAVLAPGKMAALLTDRLAEMARLTAEQEEAAGLEAVLLAVRNATGHDFHCYKRATLERRTQRRMALHHVDRYDDYARRLRTDTQEAAALRKDLLIGVTEFFRQPEAWRHLEEKVVLDLVQKAQPGSTLRVWVPACSIGKEAYSVAMLLVETIERSGKNLALQIFATDADASAVDAARSGLYAEEDLEGLSQSRLKRFCARKNGRYEFVKELRSLIVFAPQDLTTDPPFSKLDLITCRNLLIYLDQTVQRKIIQLLHFALRDGGYLFLGSAETVCGQDNLFEAVSPKWRIYRKLGVTTPVRLDLPLRPQTRPAVAVPAAIQPQRLTLPSIAQQALAERFGPAAAIVDRKGALLYMHGDVEEYLQLTAGEHTGLLADAAREGLRSRLTSAVLQAVTEGKRVVVHARVRKNKKSVPVKVTVSPLRHPREAEGLLLVTFETQRPPKAAPPVSEGEIAHGDVRQLEDELKITREELSSTIDQLEQSNEHLKASNEEVTAANEELQSTNEELETSKEELQSLNEELNAVNLRLQEKVAELEQASNDVSNLLTSGSVATIFLDKELKVRRFTPAVTGLLSLVGTDVGRPIVDIHRKFHDEALLSDARRVLVDLAPATAEVRAEDGAWYSRRILPYRTQDDRIEGVVITFHDVTDLKELADALQASEASVRRSEERHRLLAETMLQGVVHQDADGKFVAMNPAAERILGKTRDQFLGSSSVQEQHGTIRENGEPFPGLEHPAMVALGSGQPVHGVVMGVFNPKIGGYRWISIDAVPVCRPGQTHPSEVYTVFEDVTERKAAEEEVARLASFPTLNPNPIVEVDPEGRLWYANPAAQALLPDLQREGPNHPWLAGWPATLAACQGSESRLTTREVAIGGRWYVQSISCVPEFQRFRIYAQEISNRKRAEEALAASRRHLESIVESISDGFYSVDRDWHITYINDTALRHFGKTREEVVGQSLYDLFPAIRGGPFETECVCALETGQPVHFEMPSALFEGTMGVYAYPGSGNLTILFRDVTAQKRAEEALRKAKEEWERTFDSVPDLIAILDERHQVVRVNQAMARKLGLAPDQCVGLPCYKAVHGTDAPPDFCPHAQTLRDGRPHTTEVHEGRLGGDFLVTTTPLIDPRGRMTGSVHVARDITESKRVEGTLQTTLQRFYTVLSSMYSGVLLVSDEGRVEFANQALCDQFGLKESPAELAALDSPAMIEKIKGAYLHPEEAVARIREILDRGQPVKGEELAMRSGGMCLRDFVPLTIAGKSYGRLWIHIDITARKRAEEAVRESERRERQRAEELATLLDAVPIPVFIARDPDCLHLVGNRLADEILRIPHGNELSLSGPAETKPSHFRVLKDGRELRLDELPAQRAARGERVQDFELTLVFDDGMVRHVLGYGTPLLDDQGRPRGTVAALVDITDRKRAVEALKESEAKYRNLFENMTEEVHFWKLVRDEEGRIKTWRLVDANPPTLKTWGRKTVEEVRGRTTDEIFGPGATEHYLPVVQKVMTEGVPYVYEDFFPNLDKHFRFTTVPLGDYFITTGADITSIKKAHEALQQAAAELRRSNADLQQFAYVASHDLQEPLRMVSGFLKLLEDRYKPQLDEKAREYIGYSVEGATRMSQLITDLLAYSRVAGKKQEPQPVDANKALAGALANLRTSVQEAGAVVTQDPLPTVSGDASQFTQVLQNLLSNAIKFREAGRPCRVHVAAARKDGQWVFSVRDNGIGIDPAQHERIFVIFQRLHTRDKYPGTGIGLAICKKIIEQQGGKLWVESKIGEGSTFYFTIPGGRTAGG